MPEKTKARALKPRATASLVVAAVLVTDRSAQPAPPTTPTPSVGKTIAIAVVTVACTTAATKLVEWGVEKPRAKLDSKKGDQEP